MRASIKRGRPAGMAAPRRASQIRSIPNEAVWLKSASIGTLIVLTRGAIAAGPDDVVTDMAAASAWGLLRTVRSEHPDLELRLIDTDGHTDSETVTQRVVTNSKAHEALLRHL